MAKKRMFSMNIIDSDAFLDMPATAQNLYFHLNMRADDDGFIGNAKRIMRDIRATDDDLKMLIMKSFLIQFEDGIFVIKHWWIHNTLRNDRYKETTYIDEKNMLGIKKNRAYTLSDTKMLPLGCQNGNTDIDIDLGLDKDKIKNNNSNTIHFVNDVMTAWNDMVAGSRVSPIKAIKPSTERYKMLSARVKENGLDDVLNVISMVGKSDFLMGRSDKWLVTFDWVVKPSNYIKIAEGNYLNADDKKYFIENGIMPNEDSTSKSNITDSQVETLMTPELLAYLNGVETNEN